MNIWISHPSIFIPDTDLLGNQVETVDEDYQRLHTVFEYTAQSELSSEGYGGIYKAEDLIASASNVILTSTPKDKQPELFVDCRSSPAVGVPAPTYKAASMLGLVQATPFLLSGQGGCEFITASLLLQGLMPGQYESALVSTTQRVIPSDSRSRNNMFRLADACASLLVSCNHALTPGFRVMGSGIRQGAAFSSDSETTISELWEEIVQSAHLSRDTIHSVIVHRYSNKFLISVQRVLPNGSWFVRDNDADLNYGCADTLVSLHSFLNTRSISNGDILTLWFAGWFGTIGVLALEYSC